MAGDYESYLYKGPQLARDSEEREDVLSHPTEPFEQDEPEEEEIEGLDEDDFDEEEELDEDEDEDEDDGTIDLDDEDEDKEAKLVVGSDTISPWRTNCQTLAI